MVTVDEIIVFQALHISLVLLLPIHTCIVFITVVFLHTLTFGTMCHLFVCNACIVAKPYVEEVSGGTIG